MKIKQIDAFDVRLPFRFEFKHSLAARSFSHNVIVRVVGEREDNRAVVGWGESIPRAYVTGETVESALAAIRDQYAAYFLDREFTSAPQLIAHLERTFDELHLSKRAAGASWCAIELAVLDAFGLSHDIPATAILTEDPSLIRSGILYGAVAPFGGRLAMAGMLWFYKLYGFKTVKLKVGADRDSDLECLRMARQILGPQSILRVDANCAWSAEETMDFAKEARPYRIASIEQPVAATRLDELKELTDSLKEEIVADESLCSVDEARQLASGKVVSGFNIRISKVGGILAAKEIARIARESGIACHMGAQVGESGILSAAGRSFALSEPPFENYEGSNNLFLLKADLTRENLNVGLGGLGKPLAGNGLGVTVLPSRVGRFALNTSARLTCLR